MLLHFKLSSASHLDDVDTRRTSKQLKIEEKSRVRIRKNIKLPRLALQQRIDRNQAYCLS